MQESGDRPRLDIYNDKISLVLLKSNTAYSLRLICALGLKLKTNAVHSMATLDTMSVFNEERASAKSSGESRTQMSIPVILVIILIFAIKHYFTRE